MTQPTRKLHWTTITALVVAMVALSVCLLRSVQLFIAARTHPQAYLVLGGNATNEVLAAQLLKQNPHMKVLISGGSEAPCLYEEFQRVGAPLEQVWFESCAQDTLQNFIYAVPILKKLNVQKVVVICDSTQAERALPPARIILCSNGIAVSHLTYNANSGERSLIDRLGLVFVAVAWAPISQIYSPMCNTLTHLPDVDMEQWYQKGFACQQQTGVMNHPAQSKTP